MKCWKRDFNNYHDVLIFLPLPSYDTAPPILLHCHQHLPLLVRYCGDHVPAGLFVWGGTGQVLYVTPFLIDCNLFLDTDWGQLLSLYL